MLRTLRRWWLTALARHLVEIAARGARRDADEALRRMFRACGRLTNDKVWSATIRGLQDRLDGHHPGMEVARRFLTQLSPVTRKMFVRNLVVRGTLLGCDYRHSIEHRLGFFPPSLMVISPTMRCNLNCYGCYAYNYPKDEELSFDEVDSIIRQGKEIGIRFVVFSGGEPFIWKPLFDVFEKHRDVFFQVYTNGTLIGQDGIARLARLGNVVPAISCEGFEAETDLRRGKGTFAKANAAMDGLKEAGVMFAFSATATSENVDVVTSDEFIDYWAEKGCLLGWYFMYIPIGRAPALELMLSPEQRVRMSRRLKNLRARKPLLVLDFWNDGEYTRGCIAGGRKYFHVNNRGDVEPCVFCHFAADNIRDKSLAEALDGPFFRAIRAAQPFNCDYRRPCMLVDNPDVLRDAVAAHGAHAPHPGAESLITDFAPFLDTYAHDFGEALKDGPVTHVTRAV